MIPVDTVNLPVCALGAGVAHAAALALVLPMMITLPAPGESSTSRLVAIPVEIVADVAPSPTDLIGALVDDAGETNDANGASETTSDLADSPADRSDDVTAALSDDVTGALPDASLSETLQSVDVPAPDSGMDAAAQEEPVPIPAPAEVANVDVVMPPLPTRVRRDDDREAIIQSRPAPPVQAAKPTRRAPPPNHGLFGLAKPPRAPVAKAGEAPPYKGSWDTLLGKPAL